MEEEGSINFKALRARFQEEALLAQSRSSRPAVAEKPKHLPPPGDHCSSVVSSINVALESKTLVVPSVFYRDGQRASGGRRPVSFPEHQKSSLKDRHMPLVLPALPVKDQTTEAPAKPEQKLEPEAEKEVVPQTKIKKKGLLLPFKSSKSSRVSDENGEESAHSDPACSAPCELPSAEKQAGEDDVALQSDQSTAECPVSSPDATLTPPLTETSTLEKAKKKFSYKNRLISASPSWCRPLTAPPEREDLPSPPSFFESSWADLPAPPPVREPQSPSTADYKEQKKREKQPPPPQVTGDEEPMYHAKVTVANKVRKNDLPVKTGDTVSIIRTTNCPRGKWLARDAPTNGYISVMNVELNIKEMLELGKKAQAAGRGGSAEGDNVSVGSRYRVTAFCGSAVTDDSEEWACEDETLSPCSESQ
uniref:Helically-extended SH3 domain-containing protein n=1 Tax=Salarias fasciatus TaxID=181472 RepID=A0A672H8C2_SALFA